MQYKTDFTVNFASMDFHDIETLKRSLQQLVLNEDIVDSQILLNFEHLYNQPWLGGDTWIINDIVQDLSFERSLFEIVPTVINGKVNIQFNYVSKPDNEDFDNGFKERINDENLRIISRSQKSDLDTGIPNTTAELYTQKVDNQLLDADFDF